MKELVIVTVSPSTLRFAWENYIYLHNLREMGLSGNAQILVFIPWGNKGVHPLWEQLEADFPESKFFHYNSNERLDRTIGIFDYIPLLRPYCLALHFMTFPELKEKAILYTDSDILLTEKFDISAYLDDDVCYLSEANSYTNADYFNSKYRVVTDENSPIFGEPEFVVPGKYEGFKRRNVIKELGRVCGITAEKIEEHNNKSGAAQYLLKNIDYTFWNNVFDGSAEIKTLLSSLNQEYMRGNTPQERTDKGFQGWCSDIWAVQFNLYRRNYPVETPSFMNFSWATDDMERVENTPIFHNAGITSDSKLKRKIDKSEVECNAFFKGRYSANTITPFQDMLYLNNIINDPVSKTFGTYYYTQAILATKAAYNL